MSSSRTAKLVQLQLLDVMGNWPVHSTCTSDGDTTGVFALAVSFWNPSYPTASPSLRCWAESWPRGSFRGTRPGAPPAFALASPCLTQALLHGRLSSERGLWVLCPFQATVVMWKILHVPCIPPGSEHFTRLFVHLLLQVFFSTLDTPEELKKFWKGCQEEHGFAASPNRFSIPVLLSLPCPQGRSQCSQHDLSFVLHTGLQWRP